jgi:preprotein translocase subunit SecF
MNILGKRYFFFALSLVVILPGLIMIAFSGLPLSIDFTGGSLIEFHFDSVAPPPAEVFTLFEGLGLTAQVQTSGEDTIIARTTALEDETRQAVLDAMRAKYGSAFSVERLDTVGPAIGEQVTQRAALAVGVAALAVVLYITFAFRGIANAFRYGACAIIAMVHDVALVFSITAIGGMFWGWQVDALFLTALLTVIGFSVQDKIVVFDRIRENASVLRRLPFETLANHSIVQTLQRSINTQLMTVEFMLLALALFGGETLREFALILLIGLFSGTYSSIFIAAPILVVWEKQEWKNWFGRKPVEA